MKSSQQTEHIRDGHPADVHRADEAGRSGSQQVSDHHIHTGTGGHLHITGEHSLSDSLHAEAMLQHFIESL